MAVWLKFQNPIMTTVSPYMSEALSSLYRGPIEVIPNPIDDRVLSLSRGRSFPSDGRWRIAMVMNGWGEGKNPRPAFRAFNTVKKEFQLSELHVYGDGYERDGPAHRWCVKERLEQGMVFHGRRPHAEIVEVFERASILLHPSIEESFGMVLIEAMALGVVPVGGADSGAVPWLLGAGRYGVLTDVRDHAALSRALLQLMRDEQGFLTLSRRGLRHVSDNFSADAVAEAYIDQYEKVIAHYRKRDGSDCRVRGSTRVQEE